MPPKVNTLFNYFTSPKGVKPPSETNNSKTTAGEDKATPRKMAGQREKTLTPKSTNKKGKENRTKTPKSKFVTKKKDEEMEEDEDEVQDKKRRLDSTDDSLNESKDEKFKPKRRRVVVPDLDSDTEDDYVPDPNASVESDEASEGEPESELETEPEESEDETPKKKRKTETTSKSKTPAKGKAGKPILEKQGNSGETQKSQFTPPSSWPHLSFPFLQPDKIRDAAKKRPDEDGYNPKTLYIPPDFLKGVTPGHRQWWDLKAQHFDCILFFKVGKFYELYHMDAVIAVELMSIMYMKGDYAHCGFPEKVYGKFAGILMENGYKVARVEQTETPAMNEERLKKMHKPTRFDKVVNREICQIGTKGTRVLTDQSNEAPTPNSNFLMSVIEKPNPDGKTSSFGVCFVDTTIGDFYLSQFEDDKNYSRLLTLFSHHPPAHLVLEIKNLSKDPVRTVRSLNAVKEWLLPNKQFWTASDTLKRLFEGDYFKKTPDSEFVWPEELKEYMSEDSTDALGLTPAEDKELALRALGGCIYVLKYQLLDQQLLACGRFKTYVPIDYGKRDSEMNFPKSMIMDHVTLSNLKIFGKEGSLERCLDHCATAFGKRLLHEWLCRPSCQKELILRRQEAITELMDNSDIVQSARSLLSSLPDLERLLSKIQSQGNYAKMWNHPDGRAIMFEGNIYSKKKITDFISTMNGFDKALEISNLFNDATSPLLTDLIKSQPTGGFPDIQESLDYYKNSFNQEEAKKEGSIKPKRGVDEDYDSCVDALKEIHKDLDDYLVAQTKHFGTKIKYIGTNKTRYQIEVPEAHTRKVGSGYDLVGQRKGFKRYYTAETRELLARLTDAEERMDKVLKDITRKIFAAFCDKYDMWSSVTYKLSVLDVLISLSIYAMSINGTTPIITQPSKDEKAYLKIKNGVYPSMESANFVPNDTSIATDAKSSVMILTGPNMGGKSTLMRQVGLITVLAQIGSYVPAESCELTLVDRIFTRLGANDDILTGQSTFFIELAETSSIIQHASAYSLVLLDELGRGTSTYDGTAIAASVVDFLTKVNCRTIFSTHYHSLVEDYKTNENVSLTHMACEVEGDEIDGKEETVTFLYKLSDAACPKSYGFNAARLAGVPSNIIKRGREIAESLERVVKDKRCFLSLFKGSGDVRSILNGLKELKV